MFYVFLRDFFKKNLFTFFRKRVYADFLLTNCFNNHFQTHILVVKNPISVLMEEKMRDILAFCAQSGVFQMTSYFESLKRHESRSRRNCALQDSSRFSLRYLCVRKQKVQLPRCVLQHSIGLHESV